MISQGDGISSLGQLTISGSTISGNVGNRGGVAYEAATAIHNGTISGNSVNVNLGFGGGGIESDGPALSINKTTVSGNRGGAGNGVGITSTSLIKFQNSIVANNAGGDCSGTITSNGYNLSSDGSCNFHGPGDMNDTNPLLGPLQYNGEPTKTQCWKSGD